MFNNQKEIRDLKARCKNLERVNELLTLEKRNLEIEVKNTKELPKNIMKAINELPDVKEKIKEITREYKASEAERVKLEKSLKEMKEIYEQLKSSDTRVELLQKKIENIEAEKIKQATEISKLKNAIDIYSSMNGNGSKEEFSVMRLNQELVSLDEEIKKKRALIVNLDDQIFFEEHGFYSPKYKMANSEEFRNKLISVQEKQKEMIRSKMAVISEKEWAVAGDYKLGKKLITENQKLMLRSFNNECEAGIAKMKLSNYEAALKKIQHAYETLNVFGDSWKISISKEYLSLKIEELDVAYEYEILKQKEKDDAALERERLKEIARVEKELEEARQKNEKEKTHLETRLKEIVALLTSEEEIDEEAQERIIEEQRVIEEHLEVCEIRDKELDYREQNQSAGYVYIISNLGAFGEDVYKIGVTRRLDPNARIDELGSASVPFRFDTHALIFSEKAFQLENALHKAFESKRVNLVNRRKEFFKLDLNELNEVLKNNFNKHFELKLEAEAKDYRETLRLRESGDLSAIISNSDEIDFDE